MRCTATLQARLSDIEEQAAQAAAALRGSLHALSAPPEQVTLGVALRGDCRALHPEIAEVLGLTRNTVKTYLQRTLEKLGARNRVEALARANECGIL